MKKSRLYGFINLFLILVGIILISIGIVQAGNIINLKETFGDSEFNLSQCFTRKLVNNVTCNKYIGGNVTYDECMNWTTTTYLSGTTISLDNDWYCLKSHDVVVVGELLNESQDTKSDMGAYIVFEHAGIPPTNPSNTLIGFSSVYEETYDIVSGSIINFSCRDINPIGNLYLTFGKEGDRNDYFQNGFSFPLNMDDASRCGFSTSPSGCCNDLMQNLSFNCASSSLQNVSIKGSDIIQYCPFLNYTYLKNFDRFGFTFLDGTIDDSYIGMIDDLNYFFINGTNLKPTVVGEIETPIQCINDTGTDIIFFNVSISGTDVENDTILYDTVKVSRKNFNNTVVFSRIECGTVFCDEEKHIQFVENVLRPTNESCDLYTEGIPQTDKFYMANFVGDDTVNLILHTECVGSDKNFYYELDYSIDNLFYFAFVNNFFINETSFNMSFYDEALLNELFRLKYEYDGVNVSIYDWNSTNFNLILNRNLFSEEFLAIDLFDVKFNQTTGTLILPNSLGDAVEFEILVNNFPAKVFSIGVNNGVIGIQSFTYSGIFLNPVFSPVSPTNFTANRLGTDEFILFYTDSEHLNTYETLRLSYTVVECEIFIPRLSTEPRSVGEALNGFKITVQRLCTIGDGFLSRSGSTFIPTCTYFRTAYLAIVFVLSAMLAGVMSVLLGATIGFQLFAFTFFAFGWVGTYIFDFGGVALFVVGLIGFLGVVNLLAMLFLGRKTEGGGGHSN